MSTCNSSEKKHVFIGNRSEQAFRWTCARLTEYAQMNGQRLYFWTFTFVTKMPPTWYARRWAPFVREVLDLYRNEMPFYGIKVTEQHKRTDPRGIWKGLHYHAIVNHRVSVGEVRRIGARYGVGRVQVSAIDDAGSAIAYLGKYLRKGFIDRDGALPKGIRRWGTIGGFNGCRVADIQWDTGPTRACRKLKEALGRALTFGEICDVCSSRNITDPFHLQFLVWFAEQKCNSVNPLAPLHWSWCELEREIGLPHNPYDGNVPF